MDIASLTIRVVNQGLDAANRGLNQLRGGAQQSERAIRSTEQATQSLSDKLNRLRTIAGGAFAGIGIQSLLRTADTMQNLDSQVRLVTNSMEQFKAVQSELRDISNRQYADIESLTQLYTRSQRALSNLGKSQREVLQFTENISMAMLVGGSSAQEQAAALLQLSQALGSGVLAGEEFRSIAEQAPILLSLISKEMGVTRGELKKLASDGKITSEIIYNALMSATDELTEQVASMPITVGQAFTVLKNNYKTFVGDFINNTTGLSGVVAGAIGAIAQNFDTLATVLMAGAAVWGVYALAGSAFVTTTIPALILGIQTTIFSILSQSAAMQTAIASTFSLAAMQDVLTAATYRLQQARVVASLTLLNYKLLLLESIAVMQAKIASVAGAIAVQAQYALALATSGNLLAIFSLSVKSAVSNLVAKVSATAAAARANAIYAASLVSTNGIVGATSLGIRALTGMIVAKTGAMIAAVRQTSAYSLAVGGLGLAASATTGILTTLTATVARLGAVILAHPLLALAAVIFSVTASTRGWKKAMEDVTDAIKILGFIFLDVVRNIVDGVKWVWSATSDWFKNTIGGGGAVTTFLSSVFGKWFEGTRGGFVGLLQVVARVFDSVIKVAATTVMTLGKGFYNLYVRISNLATGMGNSLIDAFNWAARGVTSILNTIGRGINDTFDALNELPLVNIKTRARVDWQPIQVDRGATKSLISNSWDSNMAAVGSLIDQYGAEALVNRGIKALDEHKAATEAANKAALDAIPNFEAMGEAIDGAGKKAKKGAKNLKEAKEKMSEAEKAAKALNDAFLKAQQGLQRTFNLIGHETNLAQWVYDLSDPMHELYNLTKDSKNVLKGFAASIDISELSYDLGKSNKDLEHQIKLLDAKSDLERELMDIEKETADLLEKYEVFKNIPGFAHVYKEIEAEAKLNEQWKKNLATKEATVAINKELTDAADDMIKQVALMGDNTALAKFNYDLNVAKKYAKASAEAIEKMRKAAEDFDIATASNGLLESAKDLRKSVFLFGNDSPLDSFLYDLQETEKYANASAEAVSKMLIALDDMERLKAGNAFNGLLNDMSGVSGDPTAKIMQDYEDRLEVIRRYEDNHTALLEESLEARLQVEQAYNDARRDMILGSHELIAGNSASMLKGMLGEQSKAYRLMFAIEKGYAITKAALAMKSAIAEAMKMPYPQNIAQMGIAAAQGAKIVSDIRAIAAPIGQAHDGIMSVPKSGTWNLEKGERVLPAHTAKAMDKKLEQSGSGEVNITINVDAQGNSTMDAQNANQMSRQLANTIKAVVQGELRQERRQGGLFSGA